MALKLYFHPLASFCWKALIALYERGTPFEPIVVDPADEASMAAFRAIWPIAKMPVLRDEARDMTVAESSIVVEYLDAYYADGRRLLPADADDAWRTRMWDRFYDHYVHLPMQKIVHDRLRPDGRSDLFGVEEAKARLTEVYGLLEREMRSKTWAAGEEFTLADCAAAPALFYADTVAAIGKTRRNLRSYLDRLAARPSFARVLQEAAPYFDMFPMEDKPRIPDAARAAGGSNRAADPGP